jgi:hypothetical protein
MNQEHKLQVLSLEYKVNFGNRKRKAKPKQPVKQKPVKLPRITRLLALAHHLQGLLNQGVVKDYADIAKLSGLSRARVTQIMNLLLLAPEIQEAILDLPVVTNGRDLITDVPPSHWLIDDYYDSDPKAADKTYCRRGAFLDQVAFDPMCFGIPPSIVPATDSSQLLAGEVRHYLLHYASEGGATVRLVHRGPQGGGH